MSRVAVIGANGQLAHDLIPTLEEVGYLVAGLTHAEIEVIDLNASRATLTAIDPHIVINTSAYHKVDEVEDNPERAFAVNAIGPYNLALICRELDTPLVHMSTDYVFSGSKGKPYVESDCVDPINIYGLSKAAGEMAIRALWPKHVIIRSSGLYGLAGSSGKGGNFIETMLRLAGEGRAIKVVDDQTLTPTSTHTLAQQVVPLLKAGIHGTFHATCQGECTWFTFAAEIFRQIGLQPSLAPQTTAESGARARRPPYSVLENAALKSAGLDILPPWEEALQAYLIERNANKVG
ncbi:MAG: dTDP-4-dehydrorhamnose reductase [Chloroflexota bacterium]